MKILFYSTMLIIGFDSNPIKIRDKYGLGKPGESLFEYLNGGLGAHDYLLKKYNYEIPKTISRRFPKIEEIHGLQGNIVELPEPYPFYGIKDLLETTDITRAEGGVYAVSQRLFDAIKKTGFKNYITYPIRVYQVDQYPTTKNRIPYISEALTEWNYGNLDIAKSRFLYTDDFSGFVLTGDPISAFSEIRPSGSEKTILDLNSKLPPLFELREFARTFVSNEFYETLMNLNIKGCIFYPIYEGDTYDNIRSPHVKRNWQQ